MEEKNSLVLLKEVLTFLMARLSWSLLGPPRTGCAMCSALLGWVFNLTLPYIPACGAKPVPFTGWNRAAQQYRHLILTLVWIPLVHSLSSKHTALIAPRSWRCQSCL